MQKRTKLLLSASFLTAGLIGGWNYLMLQAPLSTVINNDSRNHGIQVWAYHQWLITPGVIVFDIRGIDGEKSRLDVTRVLLQFADRIKERRYDRVILAHKGKQRFQLTGEYIQSIGQEFDVQNPVYTIRTLPENTYQLDGSAAFSSWSGGILGVVSRQMEDFNALHSRWYIDELQGGEK